MVVAHSAVMVSHGGFLSAKKVSFLLKVEGYFMLIKQNSLVVVHLLVLHIHTQDPVQLLDR